MEKIILGKKTDFNLMKLGDEFLSEGLTFTITEENGQIICECTDTDVAKKIANTHDPTPMPPALTDLQQTQLAVAEAVEKQETDKIEQQLAQAEMFETILKMLEPQGGGE